MYYNTTMEISPVWLLINTNNYYRYSDVLFYIIYLS